MNTIENSCNSDKQLIAFKYCVKREDKTDQSNPQNKKKKKTDATKLFLKVKKTDFKL